MAVTLRDLKVEYDKKGKKRVNRSDKQGNLYLFYQDKKERIIIRDMVEDDAKPWVKVIKKMQKLNSKETERAEETFKKEVRKRKDDDLIYCLMVTSASGKIIGTMDVYPVEGEYRATEAIVQIGLKDQNTIDQMAETVIRAVKNLHQNYRWYDKVFLKYPDGELEDLSK